MLFAPFLILVLACNYFVDPANVFGAEKYIGGAADILSQGHNVDRISNYDERLLQEAMVKRLRQTPDRIVLGSSRIMEVGSDLYPDQRVLNCGVSHANIRDIAAITGLLDSLGRLPTEVLLNVDAGLISSSFSSEYTSLQGYFDRFLWKNGGQVSKGENGIMPDVRKLEALFSIKYFQDGIKFLYKRKSKVYSDVGKEFPVHGGRFSDGTVAYTEEYRSPNVQKVAGDAAVFAKKSGVGEPDAGQSALLTTLLDFYASRHVTVKLCMLPYHPAFVESVNKYHDRVLERYESYYRDLASRRGLEIRGSFDPARTGLVAADFYDMFHCTREKIRAILTK